VIKQHKRVLFGGDGYSAEWHKEAARRGLPILQDSVAAFPVLTEKKNLDLFRKYGVLSKVEIESRAHIAIEKFVKQLVIEAETMVSMGRTMILPAAVRHQKLLADTVKATEDAGVKAPDAREALAEFTGLVTRLRKALSVLEKAAAHQDEDPMTHARHIKVKVRPAMAEVRAMADGLEAQIASDLWPMPTYREMLMLK
jgi:glutamine synthetase